MSFKKSISRLLVLFVFLMPANIYAQIWLEHEAIYDEADGYLQGEEFEEAIPLFQLLEKKGLANANVSYKLGVCFLGIAGKKEKAIPYLESAVQNTSNTYVNKISEQKSPEDAYLKLGVAYRIANRFDDALEAFELYRNTLATEEEKRGVDAYVKQVNTARFFKENDTSFRLSYINDNSNYSLSNPVVLSDSLVFYMEERPFYDAVVSGAIKNNVLIERANLTPQIGTEDELVLLSVADKGTMLLFRAYVAGKGYELYYSLKGEDGYSEYTAFDAPINSPSSEMFASMSSSGKRLYFSSNRPGGRGGTDIYVSEKDENGIWGPPINLGPIVNTPFNEDVCYISPNESVLYLSSQGHVNSGGFDLFYAIANESGGWDVPVNFGYPVSTADDDNFISVSLKEQLYTSRFSMESGGREGVFLIDSKDEESDVPKRVMVYSTLEFNDSITAKEVPYIITRSSTDEVLKRGLTNNSGEVQNLMLPDDYLLTYIYSDEIQASQKLEIKDDVSTDELYLSPPVWVISKSEDQIRAYTVDDILFDFNSVDMHAKYYPMLDTLVNSILAGEITHVRVVGHSDAIGNSAYNEKLSYKRALAVASYLKQKGVVGEKLSVLSNGEQNPIAKNTNPDGTDNPVGRKYNRRVELVLETEGLDFIIRKTEVIPEELLIP